MSTRSNVRSARGAEPAFPDRLSWRAAVRLRGFPGARGFTLIELMVVIALVAVIVGLAVPSFARLASAAAISSGVNQFLADMRFARSEAVRRGGGVVLCRSDDPESSDAACSASPDIQGWASGWIIFHDRDGNGQRNSDEDLLRVQARHSGIDTIATGGTPTLFRFAATGRLLAPGPVASLQFGGSNLQPDIRRVVCVNAGGRARIAGDGTATCGEED